MRRLIARFLVAAVVAVALLGFVSVEEPWWAKGILLVVAVVVALSAFIDACR